MDEIISVILLLFIFFFWGGHKLYARGCQIFKYGPDININKMKLVNNLEKYIRRMDKVRPPASIYE
jgi:hypothetical protein